MDLKKITPIVLTFNEEANIDRCLASLAWAEEILVVDSFSTDGTLARLARYPRVQVEQRAFDSFAGQWNFALASKKVKTPWVLTLDADYVMPEELVTEIRARELGTGTTSLEIGFIYCVYGTALSASLYPPLPALFAKEGAVYQPDGHTMRLQIPGKRERLRARLLHDDRKSIARWLSSQSGYMDREVAKLAKKPREQWSFREKLRMGSSLTPFLVFFYTLIVKRAIFDGTAGILYAYQRLVAELVLQLKIGEARFNGSPTSTEQIREAKTSAK